MTHQPIDSMLARLRDPAIEPAEVARIRREAIALVARLLASNAAAGELDDLERWLGEQGGE